MKPFQKSEIKEFSEPGAAEAYQALQQILVETAKIAEQVAGHAPLSFAYNAVDILAHGMEIIDPAATSKILAAMAVLADPNESPKRKELADAKRRAAFEDLVAARDIHRATRNQAAN